jgi:hypothetical protein
VRIIDVVAAVIERGGKVLITRAGPGRAPRGAVGVSAGRRRRASRTSARWPARSAEELGVAFTVGERVAEVDWQYPDKRVRIAFFRGTVEGEPRPWRARSWRG